MMTHLLLLAFFFGPQARTSLSGTVADSVTGQPLPRVQLVLEPLDRRSESPASAVSDDRGGFRLADLSPGRYRLCGRLDGYFDGYFGARRQESYGTVIALEAGQSLAELTLRLRPAAGVAGTVRNGEGQPAAGAAVSLSRLSWAGGVRRATVAARATTDEFGHYLVAGLAPGKYIARVEGPIPTLYPGTLDVAAGARIAGIDIALLPTGTFHVSGRVVAPEGTAVPTVKLQNDSTDLGFAPAMRATSGGGFEFRGVPAGVYSLTGTTIGFNRHYATRMSLRVTAADVEGVLLTIVPGAAVAGRVKAEGKNKAPWTDALVVFSPEDGSESTLANLDEPEEQDKDKDKGGDKEKEKEAEKEGRTFSAELLPGHYTVYFNPTGNRTPLYVKRIRSGGVDVLRDGLTISQPGKVPLEILVASGAGRVDGVVLDAGGNPAPDATVVLAPAANAHPRIDRFQASISGPQGRYEFQGVPPGEYRLFAWDGIEDGAWYEPGFLARHEGRSQAVTVLANGHVTERGPLLAPPGR